MNLTVILEDEDGKAIKPEIDSSVFCKYLPDYIESGSSCLRFIDPYGDTTFNRLQVPTLLKELTELEKEILPEECKLFINELKRLCQECLSEVHTYIKFYGD